MIVFRYIFFELEVDYLWFYSSLSQSLAALIGIVGMLIVYRLQIQQGDIREAVRSLQMYLTNYKREAFFYLTEKETILAVQKDIEVLKKEKEDKQTEIHDLDQMAREGQQDAPVRNTDSQKARAKESLRIIETKLEGWSERFSQYRLSNKKREQIKNIGFRTIVYLLVLFLVSLLSLSFTKYFKDNYAYGFAWFWTMIIFLCAGLYLLIRCSYISFSEK